MHLNLQINYAIPHFNIIYKNTKYINTAPEISDAVSGVQIMHLKFQMLHLKFQMLHLNQIMSLFNIMYLNLH